MTFTEFKTSARIDQILKEIGYDIILGIDVIDLNSVGSPEQLEEGILREEIERAIKQGADRNIVEVITEYLTVMVVMDSGIEEPVTALRFEMDALSYEEA